MHTINSLIQALALINPDLPVYIRDENGFDMPFSVVVLDNEVVFVQLEVEE